MRQYFLALLGILSLTLSWNSAPAAQPAPATDSALPAAGVTPLVQLGPGDQVKMSVFGQPTMDGDLTVADDGTLRIPLAGTVRVAGLSPAAAAQQIESALKQGQFLLDPHVTITVLTSRSQRVAVLGEVGKPGTYPIESDTTVFQLLALAGGETEAGGDTVYVMRPDASGHVTRYTVSLRGYADASDVRLPTQSLKGGDQIYVPKASQFYISGEVQTPGTYKLQPGMTVLQAISRAGGITVRGSARRVELKRKAADGQYQVLHPKSSDPVEADDILRVKESIF